MLVASASNDDVSDQGAPAVELQPGDAPNINAGRGLVVTAADFDDTRAATGFGSQISLAAYGFFDDGPLGPPGLISTYPRQHTPREGARRLDGVRAAAARWPTATTTPTCRAPRWPRRRSPALAALVSDLNPFLTLRDKLTLIKADGPPPGRLELRAGLGHHRRRRGRGRSAAHRPPGAHLEGPGARSALRLKRGQAARPDPGALDGVRSRRRARPDPLRRSHATTSTRSAAAAGTGA